MAMRETLKGSESVLIAELLERHGAVVQLERSAEHGSVSSRLD